MIDSRGLHDKALAALAKGDWVMAAGHYTALERANPGDGIWPLKLGECLRKLGKPEDAVQAYTRALTAYTLAKTFSKAVAVCRLILDIEPNNRRVLRILGCLHEQRSEPAEPESPPPVPPSSAPPKPTGRRRDGVAFAVPSSFLKAERAKPRGAPAEPTAAAVTPIGRAPTPDTVLPGPDSEGVATSTTPPPPADVLVAAEDPLVETSVATGSPTCASNSGAPGATATPATLADQRSLPRVVLPLTPFFAALDERQARLVNARAHLVDFAPGEIVYAAGEPSHLLFVVAVGEIAVLMPQEVARVRRGDFFGEEAVVLPGHPRTATMRAAQPCQLLVLEASLVGELISDAPVLGEILSCCLWERLVGIVGHTSPLLASVPESDRRELLARFRQREANEGSRLYEAGQDPEGLFIVLAGGAAASLDEKLTERLRPGDVFGEIALVSAGSVSLTVTARARCFVLYLPKADFEVVRIAYPRIGEYLEALAENRLARLAQVTLDDGTVSQSIPLPPRVLLVHRAAEPRQAYERALDEAGFLVDAPSDAGTVSDLVTRQRYDVVLYHLSPSNPAHADRLRDIRKHDLDVPIILLTGSDEVDLSTATGRCSVVRRFVEPLDVGDLVRTATRAVHLHRLTRVRREAMTRLNASGEWMGDRAGLEFHFDRALGCLFMAFQPIVSAVDRSVFAFEALLRSGEPLLPSPLAVLHAAERLNRVHDVGRIVRDTIAATLIDSAAPPILFVNVHSHDLLDPQLVDPRSPLSAFAPQLVLEVTERTALDDLEDIGLRIQSLRALGYRFALDNLGAGHAGIGTLAQLEPEVAKLDASLIRGIDRDSVKQDLVRATLAICRETNILTVCGAVETVRERDTLLGLGADLMQGYLFAKPGPAFPRVDFPTLGQPR